MGVETKKRKFQDLKDSVKESTLRFSFVIFLALLCFVFSTYAIIVDDNLKALDLAVTCSYGIPLYLALALFFEAKKWKELKHKLLQFAIGAVILVALYSFFGIQDNTSIGVSFFHIMLVLHLLISLSHFRGEEELRASWQMNRFFLSRIMLSSFYSGVLYVGVFLALVGFNVLFEVNMNDKVYPITFLGIFLIIQTFHFLSGVPKDIDSFKQDMQHPREVLRAVQYRLIPLTILYAVILYGFMIKIFIDGVWPEGYVAMLVSGMAILGVLSLLLVEMDRRDGVAPWLNLYSKAFYLSLLPILGLFFYAVWLRIHPYGVTVERYYLVVLGLYLVFLSFYFLISKAKDIRMVPKALLAVSLFALIGPWSASNFSLKSQLARAQEYLEDFGYIKENRRLETSPDNKKEMGVKERKNLSGVLDYILQNHGVEPLAPWFPEALVSEVRKEGKEKGWKWLDAKKLMYNLELVYISRWEGTGNLYFSLYDQSTDLIPISGYRYALYINDDLTKVVLIDGKSYSAIFDRQAMDLVLRDDRGTELVRFDFSEEIKATVPNDLADSSYNNPIPPGLRLLEASPKSKTYFFATTQISGQVLDGVYGLSGVKGILLIR